MSPTVSPDEFLHMLKIGKNVDGIRHRGRSLTEQEACDDGRFRGYADWLAYQKAVLSDRETLDLIVKRNGLSISPALLDSLYPTQPKEKPVTNPIDRVKQAEAELAAAIKAKQEQDERDALVSRFDYDLELADATALLLNNARSLRVEKFAAPAFLNLAKFRKELQPLAESYGVKIVLVGDKTTASVVLL